MNYKIILNKNVLINFIDWLPELKKDEKYYVSLFARKKYNPIVSNDKAQLKRFVSSKERLYDKIKQLECELGYYKVKNISVPNDSLVLYINPNPRSMKKATYTLLRGGITLLEHDQNFNIHAEALSAIQKAKSRTCFLDFDIDNKKINLSELNNILPIESYNIIATKGGYHILVKPELVGHNRWYKQIHEIYQVDQVGDQFIPVCGTNQGGFMPEIIKI